MSSLPRHFALRSVSNKAYLRYVHEENELHGFLQYSGDQVISPYTKFEVEKSNIGKGLVHIRCCYNNKYWVLHSPSSHYIVAAAKEREEDQSKHSCTLFKPIYDEDVEAFRFRHFHLNHYLHLQASEAYKDCAFVEHSGAEVDQSDLSTVVNWDTLFILPKYVAFKGNNGLYLRPVHRFQSKAIDLQFLGSDIADPGVRFEVLSTPDGHVRIKSVPYSKCVYRDPDWILLDNSDEHGIDDPNTMFWPVKLGENMLALRNKASNCFCRRLTQDRKNDCLHASFDFITDDAKLEITELVLSRDIYNIKFHLSDARFYNLQPLLMASTIVENNNSEDQKFSLKLSYEDTTTSTWNANVNAKVGVTMTIETGVPKASAGECTMFCEISDEYAWGKTEQFKWLTEVCHEIIVPSMTKVKGSIMATQANCDIPFSYTQRDKLMSGKYVTQLHHDGIYNVINSYNFEFVAEEV